ncbi:MAG: SDR family oxidoreductase [Chitinophagales bacterium]|nr:SDR family oxidoreductase [Chitinophagales bacterium]
MNRLTGKTAVITGANSGIGYATAKEYIAQGAKVIITGRNKAAVEKAAAELGNGTVAIHSDAGSMADVKALAGKVQAFAKKIDILFVNAGVAKFLPISMVEEADFDEQFNINVKGLYFTVKNLLPLINEGGSVILNASIVAHKGMANTSVYSATKAAVLNLGKTLSADLAPLKIRVNTISPGPIDTPIYSKLGMPETALNEFAVGMQQMVPLKRFGLAQEIAQAAVFFGSDESSFVHGAELIVDGGVLTV